MALGNERCFEFTREREARPSPPLPSSARSCLASPLAAALLPRRPRQTAFLRLLLLWLILVVQYSSNPRLSPRFHVSHEEQQRLKAQVFCLFENSEYQRRPRLSPPPVLNSLADQAPHKAAGEPGSVHTDLKVVHSSLIVLEILLEKQFCFTFYNA